MQFDDVTRARRLMQAVDVLRDDSGDRPGALQRRHRVMTRCSAQRPRSCSSRGSCAPSTGAARSGPRQRSGTSSGVAAQRARWGRGSPGCRSRSRYRRRSAPGHRHSSSNATQRPPRLHAASTCHASRLPGPRCRMTDRDAGACRYQQTTYERSPCPTPHDRGAGERRVKFRVGRIVYPALSRDETTLGFAFPKEERRALVDDDPETFLMPLPNPTSVTTGCGCVSTAIEREQLARRSSSTPGGWCVPKGVAAELDGRPRRSGGQVARDVLARTGRRPAPRSARSPPASSCATDAGRRTGSRRPPRPSPRAPRRSAARRAGA